MDRGFSRRDFFHLGAAAALGFTFLGKIGSAFGRGRSEPLPPGMQAVPATDPVAQSLGYKAHAREVNKSKFPNYQPSQHCKSCTFYTKVNAHWGKCQVIQGGVVNADGWCASWSLKK